MRQAQERTGIAAADFSRIRNAAHKCFTLDRLMGVVNKPGSRVEVALKVTPASWRAPPMRSSELMEAQPTPARYSATKAKV